jgi:hypothetical protein
VTVTDVQQAMQRYFDALGSERFLNEVDPGMTWTVTDSGDVIRGSSEVRRHLDTLHAAMVDTRTSDLVLGSEVAVLEGDCTVQDQPGERVAFCVVYEVREQRVSAARLYGRLEAVCARRRRTPPPGRRADRLSDP